MTHYGFWNFCGDHPFLVFLLAVILATLVHDTAVDVMQLIAERKKDES